MASHEEDPIQASLRARAAANALGSTMTSADIKKQGAFVPASLSLKVAGKDALIQFELPAAAQQSASKPVFSGTPAKSL